MKMSGSIVYRWFVPIFVGVVLNQKLTNKYLIKLFPGIIEEDDKFSPLITICKIGTIDGT